MHRSQSMSPPKKKTTPTIAIKREAGFYKQVKEAAQRSSRKLLLTRIENYVGAGIPDLLICDERGSFHFIELKYLTGNAVTLQPSQVAWLTRHHHSSSWILIKRQTKPTEPAECLLYPASAAVDLKMDGITKVEPLFRCEQPFNWDTIFELTCPT